MTKRIGFFVYLTVGILVFSSVSFAQPFTPNGDGTLTDSASGLIWPQDGGTPTIGACTGGTMNWDSAFNYVSCLNAANYLGHSDWRLPHKDELLSLVTNGGTVPFNDWLNTQGFIGVLSSYYWSAQTSPSDQTAASVLYFNHGTVYGFYKSTAKYVWPVRGGQAGTFGSLNVSMTGSGTVTSSPPGISCGADCADSYSGIEVTLTATPDAGFGFAGWSGDADCADGVVTMTADKTCTAIFARFTDNGDQSMTDHITGLIWPKDGGTPTVGVCTGGAKTWDNAFSYVSCLNQNNYLGHNDWRLPGKDELASLVTNGGDPPYYTWLNSQGFIKVPLSYYWSSTTYASDANLAWSVSMWYGLVSYFSKTSSYYVFPVRGGQTGTFGSLNISKSGSGTVTSSPPGISCGADCAESYSGIEVTLTAIPDAGYGFVGWAGDADCADGVVTMTANKNCTAVFSRFTANDDQTMTDHVSGLIWPKDGGMPTFGNCAGWSSIWVNAFDYVSCLNSNAYLGHNDWRFPNIDELKSLVTNGGVAPYDIWLNGQGFNNVRQTSYFSSSDAANAINAQMVYMWNGAVGGYWKALGLPIWPVRSGQAGTFGSLTISIFGGGSGTVTSSPPGISCGADCTESYSGIDVTLTATPDAGFGFAGWSGDADCADGVVTMTADKNCTAVFSRFTANPDQSITDNLSGLIWPKDGGMPAYSSCTGGSKTWDNAFNYVSCLNQNNYLGHNDWRQPHKDELLSLATNGTSPYSDWLNSLGFINVRDTYWSSVTSTGIAGAGVYVYLDLPATAGIDKSYMYAVWPVRGGQAGTFGRLEVMTPLNGSGTVTSSPPGISCGTDCVDNYSGIDVQLSAAADAGSFYDGWYSQGYGSGSASSITTTTTSDRIFHFYFRLCADWPLWVDKRYQSITDWYTANTAFVSPITLQFMGGASAAWDSSIDQAGKVITLSGGYDCSFGGRAAGDSVISGPVSIDHAEFVFDEITVQ